MPEPSTETGDLHLDEALPGELVRVRAVGGSGPTRRRLLAVGLVPGALVEVVRKAPLRDPIEYRVRGYNLLLRARDARNIRVEHVGGAPSRARPVPGARPARAAPRARRLWRWGRGR